MFFAQKEGTVERQDGARIARMRARRGGARSHSALGSTARAQMSGEDKQVVSYLDYPQIQGKGPTPAVVPPPKWMTPRHATARPPREPKFDDYISGNEQIYFLTRVWGGLEISSNPLAHRLYPVHGRSRPR